MKSMKSMPQVDAAEDSQRKLVGDPTPTTHAMAQRCSSSSSIKTPKQFRSPLPKSGAKPLLSSSQKTISAMMSDAMEKGISLCGRPGLDDRRESATSPGGSFLSKASCVPGKIAWKGGVLDSKQTTKPNSLRSAMKSNSFLISAAKASRQVQFGKGSENTPPSAMASADSPMQAEASRWQRPGLDRQQSVNQSFDFLDTMNPSVPATPRGAGISLDPVELSKSKFKAKLELRAKHARDAQEIEEEEAALLKEEMGALDDIAERNLNRQKSLKDVTDMFYDRDAEIAKELAETDRKRAHFREMKRLATAEKKRRCEGLQQADFDDLEECCQELEARTGHKSSNKAPIAPSDREEVTHDLGDRFSQNLGGTEEETFVPVPSAHSRPVQGMAAPVERTHGPHQTIAAPAAALNDTRQENMARPAAYSRSVQDMAAPEAFASAERIHDGPRIAAPTNNPIEKPSRRDHALPASKARRTGKPLLDMSEKELEERCIHWKRNQVSVTVLDLKPFENLSKDQLRAVNLSILGVPKLKKICDVHLLPYEKRTKKAVLVKNIQEFLQS